MIAGLAEQFRRRCFTIFSSGFLRGLRGIALGYALLSVLLGSSAPVHAFTLIEGDSESGYYDLRAYARLQEDVLLFDHVPDTVSTRSDLLRRARFGMSLRLHDNWILRASGDFARRAALRDLALEYRGWPARIEIGRIPEPFSIGASINSSDTLLMNRPSPTNFGPDYGLGIGANLRGESWGLSSGIYTRDGGPTFSGRYPENAASARGTWRPLRGEWGFLHVGASASVREGKSGSGVQLSGTAESSLVSGFTPHAALQTNTDRYLLFGGETAARVGPVVILSEYIRAQIESGPTWYGDYVEAAWSLTGERRPYSTRYGIIGGVTPNHPITENGWGAWELAARWSMTDLRDGGGDFGRIASVGLNWYPVDPLRISIGGERAHMELPDGERRDGNIAQLRLQFDF